MNVTTYDSVISKEEVEALIKLTGKRYESLNLDVHFFGTREVAKEHIRKTLCPMFGEKVTHEYLSDVLYGKVEASHIYMDGETDYVFVYEFKTTGYRSKLTTVFNLFHELRHAYQFSHWDRTAIKKIEAESILANVPYRQRPIETDANHYAITMMNFYYRDITVLLGENDADWISALAPLSEEEMKVLKNLQKLYPEFYEDPLASAGVVPSLFEDLVACSK